MKIYIAKCDKFGEEVPFTKYAENGPWNYKEFWVWFMHEPERVPDRSYDDPYFATSNAVTFSEEEIRNQFFYSSKDWMYFQDELEQVRKDGNYYTELNLFVLN